MLPGADLAAACVGVAQQHTWHETAPAAKPWTQRRTLPVFFLSSNSEKRLSSSRTACCAIAPSIDFSTCGRTPLVPSLSERLVEVNSCAHSSATDSSSGWDVACLIRCCAQHTAVPGGAREAGRPEKELCGQLQYPRSRLITGTSRCMLWLMHGEAVTSGAHEQCTRCRVRRRRALHTNHGKLSRDYGRRSSVKRWTGTMYSRPFVRLSRFQPGRMSPIKRCCCTQTQLRNSWPFWGQPDHRNPDTYLITAHIPSWNQ